jgi:hypothetical protein
MIVALGSVRGSPGVSVWSMLLAAAWQAESNVERVVIEVDMDGGVAGARYGVGVEPGVLGLVTGLRHGGDATAALRAVGRKLAGGAWLVPGPESAEMARRVWSADRASGAAAAVMAQDHRRLWFCDLGRVTPTDPTAAFVAEASVTLLFTRDAPADLVQLPDRVESLRRLCPSVGVIVVGDPTYSREELAGFFGCRDVWVVPDGPSAIEVSQQVWTPARRARRTSLWRAAVELAVELTTPVSHRTSLPESDADGR